MDLYNNQIVAYKLYTHLQVTLVMDTLKEALKDTELSKRSYHTF